MKINDPSTSLGYEYKTTFWMDFEIADVFGKNAILDTYKSCFEYAKTSYIYLTEFVLVLNWRCWGWYDNKNPELSQLYQDLFYKADGYACDNLKGEELDYFYRTTD